MHASVVLGVLPAGPESAVLSLPRGCLRFHYGQSNRWTATASPRADSAAPGRRHFVRRRARTMSFDEHVRAAGPVDVPPLPGQAPLVGAALAIGILLLGIQLWILTI